MELTQNQQTLIKLFKKLEMPEEAVIITLVAVKEPEETEQLMDYIIEMHKKGKLDKDNIVEKAMQIGTQR